MSILRHGRHAPPTDREREQRHHERLRTLDVAARVDAAAEQLDRAVARLEPTLRQQAADDERKDGR